MGRNYLNELSDEQVLEIARLCQQEQGTARGAANEASLMCNRYELVGRGYGSVYDYVRESGWFANAAYYMDNGSCTGAVYSAVANVLAGSPTLPEYIDEHDCISDIVSISTGSKHVKADYVKDVTVIRNEMGATYTFYCWSDPSADGADPFGYTRRPASAGKSGSGDVEGSATEAAISQMEAWARDDSHGYDQAYRWGEKGDYDCSASVITAWELAGVPVKTKGATYTGDMRDVFVSCGFADVTDRVNIVTGEGLARGDVLLNEVHHVAMYCGQNLEVEASVNEKGTATGGTPGDQTGREFLIRGYRNFPWDCVLRYMGGDAAGKNVGSIAGYREKIPFTLEEVQEGDECQSVWVLRTLLRGRNYKTEAGKLITRSKKFDAKTDYCVRLFQKKNGLTVDGIVGKNTWGKLMGL